LFEAGEIARRLELKPGMTVGDVGAIDHNDLVHILHKHGGYDQTNRCLLVEARK
jgi:hypothetical protein